MTRRRSLEAMTTRLMDGGVRSPEAAKRLGLRGRDVYALLFAGELDGGPGRDGMVYFDAGSLEAYLERYGFGDMSHDVSNEPRRTDPNGAGRTDPELDGDLHQHGRGRARPDRHNPDAGRS